MKKTTNNETTNNATMNNDNMNIDNNVTMETKQSHKSKNDNYIVVYKLKNDKKQQTNNTMTNCTQIKQFIKNHHKSQFAMLHIYNSQKTPCRLSAWVN